MNGFQENLQDPADWLVGGGEMGKLIRAKDWSKTPLGPIDSWPKSLKTSVSLCLSSNFPINLIWGEEHTQIINDGYWPICGEIYEQVMGANYRESWKSAWSAIGETFESAFSGKTSFLENQRMFLARNGFLEETFFTFSHSPIRDDTGQIVGLFHPVTETTGRILAERRSKAVRELSIVMSSAKNVDDVYHKAGMSLADSAYDISFAAIYEIDESGSFAILRSKHGIKEGAELLPEKIALDGTDHWDLHELKNNSHPLRIDDAASKIGKILGQEYPEVLERVCLQPLNRPGSQSVAGVLILGASPRLPFDDLYQDFFNLLTSSISLALTNAQAFEQERKRAEELAALDLAKTTFFSNISHEFRTPLTLILAPVEELLAEARKSSVASNSLDIERLDIVHRNSLRLLKLVNTLLDFSRIESGRFQASFEDTEISVLTEELASSFQSVAQSAGLDFEYRADSIQGDVYVDREMWEKIVLNLVSNAFKYTLKGKIEVSLYDRKDRVELVVKDTGTGIAEAEIPHLFERFYRVKGSQGRSFEGSGIGLALVHELIKLHGGSIDVQSEEGVGTSFHVTLHKGNAHLPADMISSRDEALSRRTREMFASESMSISGNQVTPQAREGARAQDKSRDVVLLVDDNSDMRSYITHILEDDYEVLTAQDGRDALQKIREHRPNLVLSDIMMPNLDGYGLLEHIRADANLESLPVILVSARAGDEAKVEGLGTGADDYLTKPFSAKELKARVSSHLKMARIRTDSIHREAELRAEAYSARRTNQLKDEFLATVSHELRTPMNAINGFSELLTLEEPGSEDFNLAVEAIMRNSKHQQRIVNDLLDISQIISGKLSLEHDYLDFEIVVSSAVETVSLSAKAREIDIHVNIEKDIPKIQGDVGRLQQVVWNVLSNAIRFTPLKGAIWIDVVRDQDDIVLSVRDNGEGIAKEFLPYAFDSLRQEDGRFSRRHGGLGIGLSIVKQIVEAHGGRAYLDSQGKGKGTTVTINIPGPVNSKQSGSAAPHDGKKKALQGVKVLAVDDEADCRLLVKTILKRAGAEAQIASSAFEAVRMLDDYHPDVIISDIGMAEQNGYDFVRSLRASDSASRSTPAMALTAWSREEDKQMARDAGFQGHLAKPVSPGDLEAMVVRLATKH
jgi:signal transduction histidine kinase